MINETNDKRRAAAPDRGACGEKPPPRVRAAELDQRRVPWQPHPLDPETGLCGICDAAQCGACGADVHLALVNLPEPWSKNEHALRCAACLPPLPLGAWVVARDPGVVFPDHGWDVYGTHFTGGPLLLRPMRLHLDRADGPRVAWLLQNGAVAMDVWADGFGADEAAEALFARVQAIFADAPGDAWAVVKDGWVRPDASEGSDA